MFEIPKTLPYPYDSLEPFLDAHTMKLHHLKHHKGYAEKLNEAVGEHGLEGVPLLTLLRDYKHIEAIRNNGGGYLNHLILWSSLRPKAKILSLHDQIVEKVETAAKDFFGSGWVWLVRDRSGSLVMKGYKNQDNPYMFGEYPVWGVDLWEHAFYKTYGPDKNSYISNVVKITDWSFVLGRVRDSLP